MDGLRSRRLMAGSAVALLLSGMGAAGAAALAVGVAVPGAGSVSVTVPSVPTPAPTTPSLPPPPSIGAPVPAPSVPVPALLTPSESAAPSVPDPALPGIAEPTLPSVPVPSMSSGAGSSAAGGGGGAAVTPPQSGTTSSAGARPVAGARLPDTRERAAAGGVGGSAGARGGARGLPQAVAELRQCLDHLSVRQRRVLSLRAGVGPRAPLSRSQVARRLELPIAQTGRIERRGLRRLDLLAGTGACGGAAGGSGALPAAVAAHADATAAAMGLRPRFGIGGVMAHGGGDSAREDSGGRSGLGLPPPIGTGGEATLLVAFGLFVAIALLVRRELARR